MDQVANSTATPDQKKPAFHGGHFSLMGISALVLLVLAAVQAPSIWHAKDFAKEYSGNNIYGNANPSQLPSQAYTQYALDTQNGTAENGTAENGAGAAGSGEAVLGASTYDTSIPAQFSSLQIVTSPDSSAAAIQQYADQAGIVIENEDVKGATAAQFKKIASDLQAIAVPSNLADYQRLLVESFVLKATGDPKNLMAQISPVMLSIASSVQGSVGITLPSPS